MYAIVKQLYNRRLFTASVVLQLSRIHCSLLLLYIYNKYTDCYMHERPMHWRCISMYLCLKCHFGGSYKWTMTASVLNSYNKTRAGLLNFVQYIYTCIKIDIQIDTITLQPPSEQSIEDQTLSGRQHISLFNRILQDRQESNEGDQATLYLIHIYVCICIITLATLSPTPIYIYIYI